MKQSNFPVFLSSRPFSDTLTGKGPTTAGRAMIRRNWQRVNWPGAEGRGGGGREVKVVGNSVLIFP